MRFFRPLVSAVTYRRWVYLILGAALSVPYLLLAVVAMPSLMPFATTVGWASLVGFVVMLVVLAATAFLPAVRVLEAAAVRELLAQPAPGRGRVRCAAMFVLHVVAGMFTGLATLALPAGFGFAINAVFTGRLVDTPDAHLTVPRGWASAWLPAAFVVAFVVLIYFVWGVGGLLRRAAARLLGWSAAERIAQLERRTDLLAERTRLARELHDSVGHALSVVTLQAGAARRTLHTDPGFTEEALTAIEESARTALDDLDHVLGLLREEARDRTPHAGLANLPALITVTQQSGTDCRLEVEGDIAKVPAVVSREVYRILQECLTNAVRYAGKVPVTIALAVADGQLRAAVANPLGSARPSRARGGRGLRGMAERAELVGGKLAAGPVGENWEVVVTVPWGNR
ncbi:sensor histidine kinase [Amycolatopsis echigonensis]|uniref:histidine kinase n=1 Tax=Amycolatopsis echigonensis TaxID=2576905 RepID=A0A2N3WNZ4_9PSEU|nr:MULTISPECIES: histidine kinase [Amycolatopsis]MBB2499268.1 sensor histidine kinase [Amycolatopsis echigonensis]PKV95588.1 histidine kinase [Amycolatopsis niigatensis]